MDKIGIISLGCPRNLVDSEVMIGLLKNRGYKIVDSVEDADIAIVNTCAFIKDATDESLDTIFGLIDLKKRRKISRIIVAGCLAQRYKGSLKDELGEIDGFIGTGDLMEIGSAIDRIRDRDKPFLVSKEPKFIYDEKCARELITPGHSVYVKIQEGCGNKCSYCLIPSLRGPLRSRPIESVKSEILSLSRERDISEINIIGQDTTLYGEDIYKAKSVAKLLREITALKKARWIRLLYTHPAHWTEDLIDTIKNEKSICRYVDLPIQHISDAMLLRMNRKTDSRSIRSLIYNLREGIPGLAIRSTVMVGFPGETESDFRELMDFLKEVRFERLGAFIYSNEEGAPSFAFKDQVPEDVKTGRLDEVMKLQQDISREHNKAFLNKTIDVLVDEADDKGTFMGRTEFDAPSVDGEVFLNGKGLAIGSFVRAKIVDTLEYDLVGDVQ
ncbi:MAG: 30S ribosomal protein S12 methylthiotransferase RimO [Candidatus Omnitrophota bacterium]